MNVKIFIRELCVIVVPAVLFIVVYAILDAFTDWGRLIRVPIAGVVWVVAYMVMIKTLRSAVYVMIKTLRSAKKNNNT